MNVTASQITDDLTVCLITRSGQRKNETSASPFVKGIHRFPSQKAGTAEIVSMPWRHHDYNWASIRHHMRWKNLAYPGKQAKTGSKIVPLGLVFFHLTWLETCDWSKQIFLLKTLVPHIRQLMKFHFINMKMNSRCEDQMIDLTVFSTNRNPCID